MLVGANYPQGYLEFQDTYGQFQHPHPCLGQPVQWCCRRYHRSRIVPEIDMAAAQTGSNNISAYRTARNKIPNIHVLDVAGFNDVVANTTGSRIVPEIVYFRFRSSDISTSGLPCCPNSLILYSHVRNSTKFRKHLLEFIYISCSPRCSYFWFRCL